MPGSRGFSEPETAFADPRLPRAAPGPHTRLGRVWDHCVRKLATTWHSRRQLPFDVRHFDARVEFFGRRLGFYYMYHPRRRLPYHKTDEEGFATIYINGRCHRQPTTHCLATMELFHRYLESGDERKKAFFLEKAELLLNARERVTLGGIDCDVWYFRFEVPSYAPHPVPWIGTLPQTWAISILCRAYQRTGQQRFLDSAVRSAGPFKVTVADGGLRWRDPQGRVYYEKHPYPGKLRHVLNGFIYSLMGLHELYRVTGNAGAKRLFDEGIATLACEEVLDRYDRGYVSAYDQGPWRGVGPALPRYHRLHVRQLLVLHRLTGIEAFRTRAERWYRYTQDPSCRLRWILESAFFRARNLPRYIREAAQRR